MTYPSTKRRHGPKLVPTGNVDEVLLTGKSSGKDLTRPQPIMLAVFGMCIVLGLACPQYCLNSS
jgi:hypothetical protein